MKILKANNQKGFTLIELLIVVAIIGILATIIVVATADARKKGKDAAIKSNLDALQKQAAIYYLENSAYTTSGAHPRSSCPNANSNTMFTIDSTMNSALSEALSKNKDTTDGDSDHQDSTCGASTNSWATAIRLNSSPGYGVSSQVWCVDSSGASGVYNHNTNNVVGSGSDPDWYYYCNPAYKQ